MRLRDLERAEDRAISCWSRQDFLGAADYLLQAAECAYSLAQESNDRALRIQLVITGKSYADRARLLEQRAPRSSTPPQPAQSKPKSSSGAAPKSNRNSSSDEDDAGDWRLPERPDMTLDDVAGMDELKALIRERVIKPLQFPELASAYRFPPGLGVLLYGPPGTGKTYFVRALAGELDCAFFNLDSSVISKWVGETEKHLRELMEQARSEPRSVVFIDEISELFPSRGSGSTISDRSVSEFLKLVDGFQANENWMLIVGATNYPKRVDRTLIRSGRIGRYFYVGLPDATAREAILRLSLRGVPHADNIQFNEMAAATEDFSAADVAAVAEEARSLAFGRDISDRPDQETDGEPTASGVSMEDLRSALNAVHPTPPDPKMIREMDEFRASVGQ